MDRCTRNQIITSFQNYNDSDFWQHDTPKPHHNISTLSMLSQNLKKYQKAYRQFRSRESTKKESKAKKSKESRPVRNSFSYNRSYSLKKMQVDEKGKKIVVNDIENRDENSQKRVQRNSMDINVKNVQFNKNCREYKKKKDRYREIFGQRPRYILKKVKTESLQVR